MSAIFVFWEYVTEDSEQQGRENTGDLMFEDISEIDDSRFEKSSTRGGEEIDMILEEGEELNIVNETREIGARERKADLDKIVTDPIMFGNIDSHTGNPK